MALKLRKFSALRELERFAGGAFIARKNLTPPISGGNSGGLTNLPLHNLTVIQTAGTTTFASSDLPQPYLTVKEVVDQINVTSAGMATTENFGYGAGTDTRLVLLDAAQTVTGGTGLSILGLVANDKAVAAIAQANIVNIYSVNGAGHVLAYWV